MGRNVLFTSIDKREWVSPGDFNGNDRAGGWRDDPVSLLVFASVCRSRWNGDRIAIVAEEEDLAAIGEDAYYLVREQYRHIASELAGTITTGEP